MLLVARRLAGPTGTLLSRGAALHGAAARRRRRCRCCAGGVGARRRRASSPGELGEVAPRRRRRRASLGGFAYLVLFGSLLAFSAYVWLLRNARTSLVATYAYVNPVVAVALGWAVLGEAYGLRTLVAGGSSSARSR